jgi:hypothetical protein
MGIIKNFRSTLKSPRWRWALIISIVSDVLGFTIVSLPPFLWILDGFTALFIFAVLGFRWKLFTALIIEAIPALQLFPAWTLVILAMAATEKQKYYNE